MIVICTRCQAKFRVADDKVGPRGAKVRCSKCQTVFAVHRDLGSVPAAPVGPARSPPAPRRAVDVELDLVRPAADARATAPSADSDDPFGLADPDPFALSASADPFAPAASDDLHLDPRPAAPDVREDDPFAPRASLFAEASEPFSSTVESQEASRGRVTGLPVTDLSDLLGEPTPASLRGPPPAAARPPPLTAASGGVEYSLGIALEERVTPPPLPSGAGAFGEPEPLPPPAGFEAGGFGSRSDPHAFDPLGAEVGGADEPQLALATAWPPAESPPRPAARAAAPSFAAGLAPAPAPAPAEAPADRIPGGRAARVRSLAVNAAALAVLLLVAFALLAGWRTRGKVELSALRPTAVLEALRGGAKATFAAEQVSSGIYERALGPPVLFVRGVAVSRAAGPVRRLRVAVEVTRDGRTIARGEALAGAVPGAEELHGAADGAALAAVVRAAEARRPRQIRGGEAVPFLVVIADHPADLAGAALRVSVEAEGVP